MVNAGVDAWHVALRFAILALLFAKALAKALGAKPANKMGPLEVV